METQIINALKRLERLGQENSRVTEKAREAANEIERKIVEIFPYNVPLPGNYEVVQGRGYSEFSLIYGKHEIRDSGDFEFYQDDCLFCADEIYDASREMILKFSADIANGLLDRFANFMEKRKTEIEEKGKILENAEKSIGMKFQIVCRETGDVIEEEATREEAGKTLEYYETEDRANDNFVENFYEIREI